MFRQVANKCWDGDVDGDTHVNFLVEASRLIFGDPTHPENITCYLPKLDARNATVRGNAAWRKEPTNKVCERVLNKTVRTIVHILSSNVAGSSACCEMLARVNKVRNGCDSHAVRRLTRGQKAELRGMLYGNARLVDND